LSVRQRKHCSVSGPPIRFFVRFKLFVSTVANWLPARVCARVPAMGMAHFGPFGTPSLPWKKRPTYCEARLQNRLGRCLARCVPVSRAVRSGRFCGRRCGVSWVCAVRILAWALAFRCDALGVSWLSFLLWPAGGSAAVGRTQRWSRRFLSVVTPTKWGVTTMFMFFPANWMFRPAPRFALVRRFGHGGSAGNLRAKTLRVLSRSFLAADRGGAAAPRARLTGELLCASRPASPFAR